METAGLYLHVPFCVRKCPYCNFYSVSATEEQLAAYTQAVCRNLAHDWVAEPVFIDTVYFGGGTPSLLSPGQIETILSAASDAFSLTADAEITLEANPATCTKEQLQALQAAGVNRLSLGVQSLAAEQLRRLGRLHSAQEAIQTVQDAVAAGFRNISCDVMLALPGQTQEQLAQTLQNLTALPIQHISAYLLKVEPGTPFAEAQVQQQCPTEDAAADLYLYTVQTLAQRGFLQYEISNFAKPGFASRHNTKYWKCVPYLGIGPSAHSYWQGKRFYVPSSVSDFLTQPVQTLVLVDETPGSRSEQIMLRMRLTEGVPRAWLADKQLWVQSLCRAGLLRETENDHIAMTPAGFLVSNAILAKLL